jgi:enterochelin esterase-like enzyme
MFRSVLLSCSTLALVLAAMPCMSSAQAASAAAPVPRSTAPVPLFPAPPVSPTIHPDGSVTFDLLMPHAEKVELRVEGFAEPFLMMATEPGHWTYTLAPLPPEFYSYSFVVDGVNVVDPHNVTLKPSAFQVQNVFLIPGHRPWEIADVPHGVMHHHQYQSALVNRSSSYYVYTPPGFDPASKKKYPVLYLLHGYSDEDSAWTEMGKANTILDNLIAAGKAEPMIVVMPLGYGDMAMITRGWIAWQDKELVARNFRVFGQALYTEVMPRINAEYPILAGRENHAIAGLSMGGAETLLVGLNHTQDFAWIGGFSSGGIGDSGFPALFPAITPRTGGTVNASLRLLWISCGTEDGLLEPNRKLIAWLNEQGVQPMAIETPGMHVWMVWRDNLSKFVPLLFQPKK